MHLYTKYNSLFFVLLYSWWIMSQRGSWQVSPQFCLLHHLVTSVVISCLLTGYLCLCLLHHDNPLLTHRSHLWGSCAMWPSCGCRGLQWPMCAVCVDCLLCPWTVTGLLSVTSSLTQRSRCTKRSELVATVLKSHLRMINNTERQREVCVSSFLRGSDSLVPHNRAYWLYTLMKLHWTLVQTVNELKCETQKSWISL